MEPQRWRDLLGGIAPYDIALHDPAGPARVRAAERRLGVALPVELRELYLATDGMTDDLWPLERMVERNLDDWSSQPDSELRARLLAFAHNGCGEPFCVWLTPGTDVLCWYPIEDAAHRLAPRLEAFYTGWWGGSIGT